MKNYPEGCNIGLIRQVERAHFWQTPHILVFAEKHGSRYFIVERLSDLHTVSLKILRERERYGWYTPRVADAPEDIGMTAEQVAALSEGKIKQEALKHLHEYQCRIALTKAQQAFHTAVKQALRLKDGELAFALLSVREGYGWEHEGFSLELPEAF